jgi:hypothetical protein
LISGVDGGSKALAIDDSSSDDACLTGADLHEYGLIAAGNYSGDANNERVRKLAVWGFVAFHPDQPDTPVALDPKQAARRRFTAELEQAEAQVARLKALPDVSDQLSDLYAAGQLRAGGSSEYLSDQAVVNARLESVVSGAQREILAAQPGGPRCRDLLQTAVYRDTAALDRGVTLKTIYRDTVRDHPVTGEYARIMSTRSTGCPSQYRTLQGSFERMIIVDREQAFVSDHIVAGSPAHSAWHITDRAVVAVLAKTFDGKWRHADPWAGQVRPRRGRLDVDTVSSGDGIRTNGRQREILRNIASGVSQASTARSIGVSKRKLEDEISTMKTLWGARTLSELIYQWALSPDRLLDDSPIVSNSRAEATGTEPAA